MDQKKVGLFLKALRKEKNITQEALAETLNVSGRTVSRWETGNNMPDISLLVELAEFYQVSIPEIINGERKSETMDQARDTAVKMAEYSKNTLMVEKRKIISSALMIAGVFIITSALAVFPNDSSWGSIYAIIGGIILTIGLYFGLQAIQVRLSYRLLSAALCIIMLFGIFMVSDYIAVSQFRKVPRFSYQKSYGDNVVEHKTLFYTVVQKNPGTSEETVEILQ